MRLIYSALFYLASPFLILRLWLKGHANPAYRQRWRERFAWQAFSVASKEGIWLHAVSVGETEAAVPLVKALRDNYPGVPLLLTTTTPTGSARVAAWFGDSVHHVYLPYDLPGAVGRFLDGYRPRLAIFMETEIWPNLFVGCAARGVALAIVNARLSERSCRGYRCLPALVAQTLAAVHAVAAQTHEDAARFASLGMPQVRLQVLGNLKFDRELPPDLAEQGQALRRQLLGSRPVWIAASTHEGEEEQVLDAHRELLVQMPDLLLVLAPRHPQRCDKVGALLTEKACAFVRRSEAQPCGADSSVFLLDSLGELNLFYAAADVAFVGGSLVSIGGHNILEPAALGLPVLFGPHMCNFADIANRLLQAQGALQVRDDAHLSEQVARLLQAVPERARMGDAARTFVAQNRGTVARQMALLGQLLERRLAARAGDQLHVR